MVQTGVQRAFGPNLRSFLGRALRGRGSAFFAGLGVTALLQSSTATGLLVSAFAAEGLIGLVPALAVMLGANVGTTIIVQVLSFNVVTASPVLILIGVLLFRRETSTRAHDLGRVFIGLGLMLLALHQLLTLMTPLENEPSLRIALGALATIPLIDVMLGAAITWAVHSSVAVVLLVMSLAAKGAISPLAAFAFVLGANLGTAINPILEASSADDTATRRVPVGNFLIRLAGVLVCLVALEPIGVTMLRLNSEIARAVANFHSLFNVGLAMAFIGLLTPYARLLEWLMPPRVQPDDPSRPRYLELSAKETPIVALGAAAREALRLVDELDAMLCGARDALEKEDRKIVSETRQRDEVLDSLSTAIKTYLTSIDTDELSESDQRRLYQILNFTMNLEQAGDVIGRTLLPHTAKRLKRGLALPADARAQIAKMMEQVLSNLRTAASLFVTEDARVARVLADEKIRFREAEASATQAHIQRLRTGSLHDSAASALYLGVLRDMKLINSYIVSAAAYPVLDQAGELLPSRIASEN